MKFAVCILQVGKEGLEPSRLSALVPKTSAAAISPLAHLTVLPSDDFTDNPIRRFSYISKYFGNFHTYHYIWLKSLTLLIVLESKSLFFYLVFLNFCNNSCNFFLKGYYSIQYFHLGITEISYLISEFFCITKFVVY